jgi:hypothetical protein
MDNQYCVVLFDEGRKKPQQQHNKKKEELGEGDRTKK